MDSPCRRVYNVPKLKRFPRRSRRRSPLRDRTGPYFATGHRILEDKNMDMREYLQKLEELLRTARMAPRDIEDAVSRCAQHLLDAGPDRQAEVMADMGTPEELAAEILEDYRGRLSRPSGGMGLGWKIALGVLLSPIILAAYCAVFGLVLAGGICVFTGGAVGLVGFGSLLSGGVGTLLVFVGAGCATAGAGLLLLVVGSQFCKGCNWFMGRLFGGRRAAA